MATRKITTDQAGGRRQALLHAAAAALTLLIPLLGSTTRATPIQLEQIAVGIAGVVITWVVPDLSMGAGRYLKTAMTTLTAAATAAVPYLQGGWHDLSGAAGLIVATHALAAIAGLVTPNDEAPTTQDPSLETEATTTVPAPVADTSGAPVPEAAAPATGILPALTDVSTPSDLAATRASTKGA